MLAKINRLKKRKDFESILKQGKGFKEDFLVLKMIRNNLKQTRFGFIVGVKVSKKASLRNKIKRRLKGLVRIKLEKIKKGFDVILIAKEGLENKDFWDIEKVISKLFSKAKII